MIIGDINKLTVKRKTDIGYMLGDDHEEVFLHNNESRYENLKEGDQVLAYLYHDFKGRLAATLYTPHLKLGESGFLNVVDVKRSLGVFVDNGVNKDLLIGKDDLPYNFNFWPMIGDRLYITPYVKGRLVGKLVSKAELELSHTNELNINDYVKGYVYETGKEGVNVLTESMHLVFVHHTQTRKTYRLGEAVDVKITRVYEHTIGGSLIKQKENMIESDAQIILDYLKDHKRMNLTSDSDPEDIRNVFGMSKKAFKRAIGNLYKQRLIEFLDNETIYIGEEDE